MKIDILTLFPDMFAGTFDSSIVGRARKNKLVEISLHDIRSYTDDVHHTVDDYSYGGGPGMVMKPESLYKAIQDVTKSNESAPVILLTPRGRLMNQKIAEEMAKEQHLVIICGHYEGVDERVAEHMVTDQISIGDYVLSGGEIAAMVIVDCVVRLLPGALGSQESVAQDSHSDGLLEYPQYTRPADYLGWQVPPVLLSGNHAQIAQWRRQQSLLRTARYRPDLLEKASLSEDDKIFLSKMGYNISLLP